MSRPHAFIRPDTWLFLRLPNETLRLIEIKLNTIIDVGKLGSFPSNLLIGRPYYHTYEILEKQDGEQYSRLRIVSQAELNAEAGLDEPVAPEESRGEPSPPGENGVPESYDLLAEDGTVLMKNNRLTIDDASRQQLSQAEIEELKKSAGGKEIIEKILANHAGLEEKTAFSKAKYTLRKHKKYLKRFSALPMDLGNLIDHIIDKEAPRIMELREEALGLLGAWSHAHFNGVDQGDVNNEGSKIGGGRWLTVDDTGGLLVAGLAERTNILYPPVPKDAKDDQASATVDESSEQQPQTNGDAKPAKPISHRDFAIPSTTNSITLLHPAVQPNVSLLKYFGYDTSNPHLPPEELEHPLHTHLKPLSWLQLLHPSEDPTYNEPEQASEETMASWKSSKRGTYFKKRRRWERCKTIVDETREGGFDGLVIASHMDPIAILKHTVPLVRGGGHVVMYSPTIEPLVKVMDMYSKERRTAYIQHLAKGERLDEDDFPVDPRLLLATAVQTSRIREWQVLPGRTHPLMTSRGGAEGYTFTARRVIPIEGGVEARGNFNAKKRKIIASEDAIVNASPTPVNALIDSVKEATEGK
ncbi:hypothetical protein M409DRAFT_28798 [Zasmidium cellare ATCC 36951]|uniref:tRNA (adenine(58)-N(1))-methyltransferase non-catalytic subunit TRM6 n=1 Tax=Zasmidium cellare ATCC 36951 TaxID=1080233 RepID=A0A6A6C5J6_ZASCE|nr:uncharacterized protein M409DRAFT_28798 [Zasmidium cellare ATCC 36951]KAF2160656.1 hypothetical protein M409DRAFT_28798 [Zasmidium cellare ATCC 36951]